MTTREEMVAAAVEEIARTQFIYLSEDGRREIAVIIRKHLPPRERPEVAAPSDLAETARAIAQEIIDATARE